MCRVLVVLLVQTRTLNHELRHVALAPESLWTECLRGGGSCSRSCADLPDVNGFFLVDRPVANEFGLVYDRVMRRDRACIAPMTIKRLAAANGRCAQRIEKMGRGAQRKFRRNDLAFSGLYFSLDIEALFGVDIIGKTRFIRPLRRLRRSQRDRLSGICPRGNLSNHLLNLNVLAHIRRVAVAINALAGA